MDRKELLTFCRLYKGESTPPKGTDEAIWHAERSWVELCESGSKEIIDGMVTDYLDAGLQNLEPLDGVPVTLKAVLLNRYYHQDGAIPKDTKDFKDFYRITYLGQKA